MVKFPWFAGAERFSSLLGTSIGFFVEKARIVLVPSSETGLAFG